MIQLTDRTFKDLSIFAIGFANFGFCGISGSRIFLSLISSVKYTSKHSSFDRALINNNTILLIIPCKASHSYHRIASNRHFIDRNIPSRFGTYQRSLRIIKQMSQGFHSDLVVQPAHSHSLFGHSRLKRVFGSLVMIGEGNNRTANSK